MITPTGIPSILHSTSEIASLPLIDLRTLGVRFNVPRSTVLKATVKETVSTGERTSESSGALNNTNPKPDNTAKLAARDTMKKTKTN